MNTLEICIRNILKKNFHEWAHYQSPWRKAGWREALLAKGRLARGLWIFEIEFCSKNKFAKEKHLLFHACVYYQNSVKQLRSPLLVILELGEKF